WPAPPGCIRFSLRQATRRKNPPAADHFYLPRGGRLEVHFSVDKHHRPLDSLTLLDQIVAEYNRTSLFRYRLQRNMGDAYSVLLADQRTAIPWRVDDQSYAAQRANYQRTWWLLLSLDIVVGH